VILEVIVRVRSGLALAAIATVLVLVRRSHADAHA
jgi:hypothetical protein